jgi:hypothetical protein
VAQFIRERERAREVIARERESLALYSDTGAGARWRRTGGAVMEGRQQRCGGYSSLER